VRRQVAGEVSRPGELEELLGHTVDVVSTRGLKERDQNILSESVDL
jgi:hypothetical protein